MLNPFRLTDIDIAPERTREAAFWSKLLPFIMLVWAMTGAFYPAIDLVAGEKERGTLETLLCSPALRSEIVWGKLGAVTTFQHADRDPERGQHAGDQLVRVSTNGYWQAAARSAHRRLIPMLWLLVALVPLSALFSALALAVAAMARSSKEGQYYLMPLMMVTLPLVLLPMLPGTTLVDRHQLDSGHRNVLVGPGAGRRSVRPRTVASADGVRVTAAVCGWPCHGLDGNSRDEAFCSAARTNGNLSMWVRHLWRDRQTAATPAQAFACGAIILVALFFGKLAVTEMPHGFAGIAKLVLMPQIGMILAPALLMATMLTTSLRKSLRIRMPHWTTLASGGVVGRDVASAVRGPGQVRSATRTRSASRRPRR